MSGVGLDLELEKEQGNVLFASKNFKGALNHYHHVLSNQPSKALASVTLSNMSECYLQLDQYHEALEAAEKSLELQSHANNKLSEKALFRKAKALEGLGEIDHALQSYRTLLEHYPSNAGAAAAMRAMQGEDTTTYSGSAQRKLDSHGIQMRNFSTAMMKGLEKEAQRESEEEEGEEQGPLSTCCELFSYLWCKRGRRRAKRDE